MYVCSIRFIYSIHRMYIVLLYPPITCITYSCHFIHTTWYNYHIFSVVIRIVRSIQTLPSVYAHKFNIQIILSRVLSTRWRRFTFHLEHLRPKTIFLIKVLTELFLVGLRNWISEIDITCCWSAKNLLMNLRNNIWEGHH